jgi:hypothetical protein
MEIKTGVFLSETNQKPCEWCEQNESTLFCFKCDTHQLCKDCSHLLHSKQKLKSHLETIVEITTDFNIEHYLCTLHERENEFYCTNCSSFICPDCASEIVGGKHSKHQIKTKKVWKDEFLGSIKKIKENYTIELKKKIDSKNELLKKLKMEEKNIQELQVALSKISLGFNDFSKMVEFNKTIQSFPNSEPEDFHFSFDGVKAKEIVSVGKKVSCDNCDFMICSSSFVFPKKEKIYSWRIKVNSNNSSFGIGIVQSNISMSDCNKYLGKKHGYSYHSSGDYIRGPSNTHSCNAAEKLKEGDVISVIFDMKKKILTFKINGKRVKMDFENVDTSVDLTPAVCLQRNELELIDFKILDSY